MSGAGADEKLQMKSKQSDSQSYALIGRKLDGKSFPRIKREKFKNQL